MHRTTTKRWVLSLCAALLLIIGCSEDESGSISVEGSQTVELYSVTNQSKTITFHADGSWNASCDAKWLTVTPREGGSGSNTITLSTTQSNQTKNARSAKLTLSCGSAKKTITVRQRDDYALFAKSDYSFSAVGGTISDVTFYTNLSKTALKVYVTGGIDDWVVANKQSRTTTRAEVEGWLNTLYVLPNTSKEPRTANIYLAMHDNEGNILPLDTLWIHQEGMNSNYASTDYSADGQVTMLNEATEGEGIPIVIMGDGFTDIDIADGTYEKVMRKATDNLFSEEPIRSMKEYFNVYCVTAVSRHGQFGDKYQTALSSEPSYQATLIKTDEKKVNSYVEKARLKDTDRAIAVVILNTTTHNGATYFFYDSRKRPVNYAIALCATIDGPDSEIFRQVLTHEVIGHGFAKLGDEYVNSANGSATDKDIAQLKDDHVYNWFLNVDSERDVLKTIWKEFANNTDYANEEIGVYEGAFTFYKGMFRPTVNSMMNTNDSPFNAPSRRAIYNKVIRMATGREPSFDEFAAFDREHKPTVWDYSTTRSTKDSRMPQRQTCIQWKMLP